MRSVSAMLALLVCAACRRGSEREVWLSVTAPDDAAIALEAAEVEPRAALVERHVGAGRVTFRVRIPEKSLVVRAPGACPLDVSGAELERADAEERRLKPLFLITPTRRTSGLERDVGLHAQPLCSEAHDTRVEFLVTGGVPLASASNEAVRAFKGRTLGLGALHVHLPETARDAQPAIVPVSARQRAATELTLRQTLPDGTVLDRKLEISTLTRASGLPDVGVNHSVLLTGTTLTLAARPEGSEAALHSRGFSAYELVPDRPGVYTLRDAHDRELRIAAARYDETPLDCGRADCHGALARSAAQNPMLRALANDLGGSHPLASPACALACHTTGEPDTDDGGFEHALAAFDHPALPERFEALPRALRRLGGVGCLACHGPAAIPQASARWSILASDVCAVCHDAPPRYGHVAALAASSMSRADRDPRTQRDASCARCHTTWGALGAAARKPPDGSAPLGIACAACHDVHPHGAGDASIAPALLRNVPLPDVLQASGAATDGPSRVCLPCHAAGGERPEASAATLWAGRGGVDVRSGSPLDGPAPHAVSGRGCLACHDSGSERLELGRDHAFFAPLTACMRCHETPPGRRTTLAERAGALFRALAPTRSPSGSDPPHAAPLARAATPERERALRDVLLVLEDPAADVHNPAYAQRLLDAAAQALEAGTPSSRTGTRTQHAASGGDVRR